MFKNCYQLALDHDDGNPLELFSEHTIGPRFLRLAVNLAAGYNYWPVAIVAINEDFCTYNKGLEAERAPRESTFDVGSNFFLVPKYNWENVLSLVASFFAQVQVGAILEELKLKSYLMFADEGFWEDWPPRIDMDLPSLPYDYKIVGLVQGKWSDYALGRCAGRLSDRAAIRFTDRPSVFECNKVRFPASPSHGGFLCLDFGAEGTPTVVFWEYRLAQHQETKNRGVDSILLCAHDWRLDGRNLAALGCPSRCSQTIGPFANSAEPRWAVINGSPWSSNRPR